MHSEVGDDIAVGAFQVDAFLDDREITRPQDGLQLIPDVDDQSGVNAGPELRRFEIRVHARKDHRHRAALAFGVVNPAPFFPVMLIVLSGLSQAEPADGSGLI